MTTQDRKEKITSKESSRFNKKRQRLLAPLFFLIGTGIVVATIFLIAGAVQRQVTPGIQNGVGADGFQVGVDEKDDLLVKSLVSKDQVVAALGDKAKSVSDAEVSKVFDFNGIRGQTLTYNFVRSDGATASVYIDKKVFKSEKSLTEENVYGSSLKLGTINNFPVYAKHAQTIAGNREYHTIIVNGKIVYRFVFSQPARNITVSEMNAIAVLNRIASGAKL